MTTENHAFVFPGQGSQKIGMLADLAASHAIIQQTFCEASEVLGYDLWDRSQNGTADEINQTECTQPLLLTASAAIWRLWRELGGTKPSYLAGHSLGEWSALVASEVIAFADGVRLVRLRGNYMQNAVPHGLGIMAAVMGLDDDHIAEACDFSSDENFAAPVNFNGPGQVVIAGHADAIFKATAHCKELGAKRVLPLPVSAPFHTPLMSPAAEKLREDIATTPFNEPVIPVIHNVTIDSENDPAKIRELMVDQITAPVNWVATVNRLKELGVVSTVECGAGKVLSGLNKRIAREMRTLSTDSCDTLNLSLEQIDS